MIAKPGSVKTYKKFEAEIYVLTKDEGGRHTAFFSNYRPQFYMRTADITGKVELPENVKMVMPGDNVTATFELISPVPLETGILSSINRFVIFAYLWSKGSSVIVVIFLFSPQSYIVAIYLKWSLSIPR